MSTLKGTLTRLLPGVAIFDYAKAQDFNQLWQSPPTAGSVLIIWKETPSDPRTGAVDTRSHLTPLHWASIFWRAGMKIAICDLQPKSHVGNYLVDHCASLKPGLMGCVQYLDGHALFNPANPTGSLAELLFPSGTTDFSMQSVLQRHIAEHIASPLETESRHALSNVLGPLLLTGSPRLNNAFGGNAKYLEKGQVAEPPANTLVQGTVPDHRNALLAQLRAVKLCDAATGSKLNEVQQRICALLSEHLPKKTGLRVTLLDDQWDAGWFDFLKKIFPTHTVFTVTPDSRMLTDRLSAIGNGNRATYRFNLAPDKSTVGNEYVDILFLDLRLGAGGLDRGAFSTEQDFLTALPRMVAEADHSLPVVIFSSTTRKDIVDALAPYPNLITSFSKPAAFQLRSIDSVLDALVDAIRSALLIAKGRLKCQALLALADKEKDVKFEKFGHFELFIDETRSGENLIVGGLFAAFEDENAAQEFDDLLVSKGVRYFETLAGPDTPRSIVLSKDQSCVSMFEQTLAEWRKAGKRIEVGAVTLRNIRPFVSSEGFLNMEFLDTRWRLAVESIAEVFLSEVVQRLAVCDATPTVSIYGPTRVSPAQDLRSALEMQGRFGVGVQQLGANWGNHAVAHSHLYDIVANILRNHAMKVDPRFVRFFTLAYTNRPAGFAPIPCEHWFVRSRGRYESLSRSEAHSRSTARTVLNSHHRNLPEWRASLRALHYVCDSFLFETFSQQRTVQGLNAFYLSLDESYQVILRGNLAASRFADTRRMLEATVAWRPQNEGPTRRQCKTASAVIGARIGAKLDSVSSVEFAEICRRLSNAPAQALSGLTLQGVPVPTLTAEPARSAAAPLVDEPGGEEFERNKWGQETSNIVLIKCYPSGGTLQGLIELGKVGSDSPTGGVIIGNDVDDYSALLWYQEQVSAERVAIHLQKRGWSVDFAVCAESESEIAPPLDAEYQETAIQEGNLEPQVETWMLVVDGLEWNFPLERIKEAVRERYPFVSFHRKGKRSPRSSKHAASFIWPVSQPMPDADSLSPIQLGGCEAEIRLEPRR